MRSRLTEAQRAILSAADNQAGRCGWPLSVWEAKGGARDACQPLIKAGLLIERRLGGYPGVQITEAGRAALKMEGRDG